MQTLPTKEFLVQRLKLVHGNPFSITLAEDDDQLPKYFVDLPAFYKVLDIDTEKPKSSILSASRGCGKSANRRNVERWLKQGPNKEYRGDWTWKMPILVVTYTDFTRLTRIADGDLSKLSAQNHVNSILWECVDALVEYLKESWQRIPDIPSWIISQLGYYLVNYSNRWSQLRDREPSTVAPLPSFNQSLAAFLDNACLYFHKANYLSASGCTGLLQGFQEVAFALGIQNIVVLIDGADELGLTANDPKMAATLLRPLIAERKLMQFDGFYFKFFLPEEVVTELQNMPETRLGEKMSYFEIEWDKDSIQSLLSQRLKAFSNNAYSALEQYTAPDVINITETLAFHAQNNPRNLLKLCHHLLVQLELNTPAREVGKKNTRPLITKSILDAAVTSFEKEVVQKSAYSMSKSGEIRESRLLISIDNWQISADLKVFYDGKLLNTEKLDPKEYEVLNYFLAHPNQLLMRDEIGQVIWKEKWVKKYDWVLNQTILRLRKKIGSKKIETVRGLGYIFHP
jgi:hypothetical protein